jgi:hypothetical protein
VLVEVVVGRVPVQVPETLIVECFRIGIVARSAVRLLLIKTKSAGRERGKARVLSKSGVSRVTRIDCGCRG